MHIQEGSGNKLETEELYVNILWPGSSVLIYALFNDIRVAAQERLRRNKGTAAEPLSFNGRNS